MASGPRLTRSRSSHAGSLTASTTSHEPSLRRVADSCGWLSTTHSAAGASRSVTRGSSGLGWYTRSRSVRRHRASSRDRSARPWRVPRGRDRRGTGARPRRGGTTPATYQVPNAWNTRARIDDARRHLVARERVVVDLDPLVGRRSRPAVVRAGRSRRRRPRDSRARRARRRACQRGGERALGVGTRHREQRASGGEQRETFGRREAQRSFEVLGEPDLDTTVDHRHVDEAVGGVRRQPAHRQQLEVAFELALPTSKRVGELGERDAGVREDPRHEREHALQSRADERAAHRVDSPARDRVEPRHHVGAQLGR